MNTGNVRDWRENGKLVLVLMRHKGDPNYVPTNAQGETFTASFLGWHYSHTVGMGTSAQKAIRDLATITGAKPEDYVVRNETEE